MREVDALVERFMRDFDVPGAALALLLPDRPAIVRGYGHRTLQGAARVDEHTQLAIGSNSKAFLAACLALLVDEGRLSWDDPVVKYLPEFQMYDPAVTAMMTVLDLLVHRSGLPLGAGDLMLFPRTDHTAHEIMASLRHFAPVASFRTRYTYDNVLYIVAALVLERVSGMNWERFVSERILQPLAMTQAAANSALARSENQAGRHARLGPPVRGLGRLETIDRDESPVLGPAGGIHASAADMAAWLEVQLARGALPNGGRLWTAARAAEMWTPHTITLSGPGPSRDAPDRPVMQGYALGWGVQDYRGHRMVTHGGAVAGQVSRVALLPERGIGLFVCFNTEDAQALSGLRYALLDHLLDASPFDWIAATHQTLQRAHASISELMVDDDFAAPPGGPTLPPSCYVGRYRDPWYGDVVIGSRAKGLTVDFLRTPAFKSELETFGVDTFRTRFGRGLEDALIQFAIQDGAVARVTLRALSPLADFSFDFQHLSLAPVRHAPI